MTFIEQDPNAIEEERDWEPEDIAAEAEVEADPEAGVSTHALFDGDEGGLELDERKALVVLLKKRFITSESHPAEWRAIVKSRKTIAERLNDLFLELVISYEREVAYKRPVSGSREFPTLLHDTAWPREETALLVYLRVRARNEQARGEAHARVSRAEMLEYLRENRPDSATDRVSDDGRGDRAISALRSAGLLVKTDEDGVFRISPAIEPMLPVTALNNLLAWLNVRTASESDSEPASTAGESE